MPSYLPGAAIASGRRHSASTSAACQWGRPRARRRPARAPPAPRKEVAGAAPAAIRCIAPSEVSVRRGSPRVAASTRPEEPLFRVSASSATRGPVPRATPRRLRLHRAHDIKWLAVRRTLPSSQARRATPRARHFWAPGAAPLAPGLPPRPINSGATRTARFSRPRPPSALAEAHPIQIGLEDLSLAPPASIRHAAASAATLMERPFDGVPGDRRGGAGRVPACVLLRLHCDCGLAPAQMAPRDPLEGPPRTTGCARRTPPCAKNRRSSEARTALSEAPARSRRIAFQPSPGAADGCRHLLCTRRGDRGSRRSYAPIARRTPETRARAVRPPPDHPEPETPPS